MEVAAAKAAVTLRRRTIAITMLVGLPGLTYYLSACLTYADGGLAHPRILLEALRGAAPTATAVTLYVSWLLLQGILQLTAPGKIRDGTPLADGSRLSYHLNGWFTFWASWVGVRAQNSTDPFVASCPDNVLIDPEGGVWFGTDGNPGNNNRADAVYYLDLEESKAYRVASAPSDAEATGPTFTPDGSTLFFNVQHPGESVYSSWPNDPTYGPLSSLVAIFPSR